VGDAEHNLQLHQDGKGKDFLHEANEKKAGYSELHRLIKLRAIDAGDEGIIMTRLQVSHTSPLV